MLKGTDTLRVVVLYHMRVFNQLAAVDADRLTEGERQELETLRGAYERVMRDTMSRLLGGDPELDTLFRMPYLPETTASLN